MRKAQEWTTTGELPTIEQLKNELHRENERRRYWAALRSTVHTLIIVAAVVVLISTLLFPVLRIYGESMDPTVTNGDIVVSVKAGNFSRGEIIAFYYNNKILVKRVVALPGEWVDIDVEGNVTVDGEVLDEPYLTEKSFGECDIALPYQVPDGRLFVLGDNRATSVDSRVSSVGCIAEEWIVGKLVFRVWPLRGLGVLK